MLYLLEKNYKFIKLSKLITIKLGIEIMSIDNIKTKIMKEIKCREFIFLSIVGFHFWLSFMMVYLVEFMDYLYKK